MSFDCLSVLGACFAAAAGFRCTMPWSLGSLGSVVGGAGLLLLTLARVVCELYFLSLLATVRGGTPRPPARAKIIPREQKKL
jgi:hypothetical protein